MIIHTTLLWMLIRDSKGESKCFDPTITTCTACLNTAPQCAWCAQPPIEGSERKTYRIRCGTIQELIDSGCPNEGSRSLIVDHPSTATVKILGQSQTIKPEQIDVTLRRGDPVSVNITFTRPATYPVDMFYVMDLSKSMEDDLQNLKDLGRTLSDKMMNITQNQFKIGHGSFVDRPMLPFVSELPIQLANPCAAKDDTCERAYVFHNNLALTDIVENWDKTLDSVKVSSNLDPPEAGLDAILQAIVCKEEIKWEKGRFRILIFSSDNAFHVAGDGLLGGLFTPNDMQCHMERNGNEKAEYTMAKVMDYPSIGQINQAVRENQISVVFAVTEPMTAMYNNLAKLLPQAVVGELSSDSSNVVDLIIEQYYKLAKKVKIQPESVPDGVSVKVFTDCKGDGDEIQSDFCDHVETHDNVKFRVEYTWDGTLNDNDDQEICRDVRHSKLAMFGMDAETSVSFNFICDCDCQQKDIPQQDQPSCENGGNYHCGVCECDDGFSGAMCECDIKGSEVDFKSSCIQPGKNLTYGGDLCSGNGQCDCDGVCTCYDLGESRSITGKYCQCDTDVCPKGENNLPCSGPEQGKCICETNECKCKDGYEGHDCGCATSTEACQGENGSCNGHGRCDCGKCDCDEFDTGDFYQGDQCQTFQKSCSQYEPCAQCMAPVVFNDNNTYDDAIMRAPECIENCKTYTDMRLTEEGLMIDNIENHLSEEHPAGFDQCETRDAKNCLINFYIKSDRSLSDRSYGKKAKIMMVIGPRECVEQNLMVIFASVFGSVLLLGLLLLLLFALFKYLWGRHELKHFNRKQLDPSNVTTTRENPLYRNAETTHHVRANSENTEPLLHKSTFQ